MKEVNEWNVLALSELNETNELIKLSVFKLFDRFNKTDELRYEASGGSQTMNLLCLTEWLLSKVSGAP